MDTACLHTWPAENQHVPSERESIMASTYTHSMGWDLWDGIDGMGLGRWDHNVAMSIHFNESRTQLPDLLLELGHGITSLLFSEACTGFLSSYTYNTNCACLMHLVCIGRSPAHLADMMTATADLPVVKDFVPPAVLDTKSHD